MKKGPDSKIFFGLAGLAFVGGAILNYMQYGAVTAAEVRVAAAQSDVEKSETIRKSLESSRASLQELQTKLAHLESGVQEFQYVPNMLRELEQFGKSQGVQVLGVRPQIKAPAAKPDEKQTRKPYEELQVELKLRGKYVDLLRFLTSLKQFPQIIAVRSVTLNSKGEADAASNNSPLLEITADAHLFVFPEAAPAKGDGTVASTEVPSNG